MAGTGVRRNNVVPGIMVFFGGIVLCYGAYEPWITYSGPKIGLKFKDLIDVGLDTGFSSGASGEVRQVLIACGVFCLLCGLALVATSVPYLGLAWRLGAVLATLLPALVAWQVWEETHRSGLELLEDPNASVRDRLVALFEAGGEALGLLKVEPAGGLLALVVGAALVALGVVVPSSARAMSVDAPRSAPAGPAHYVHAGAPDGVPTASHGGNRRVYLIGIGVAALVLVGVFAATRPGSDGSSGLVGLTTGESGLTAAERDCIDGSAQSLVTEFTRARAAWDKDEQDSVLNLDGDPAFQDFAAAIALVDVTECPADYQTRYAQFVEVWTRYGNFLLEMAKPHAPWQDEWSDTSVEAKRGEFDAAVSDAYLELRRTAADVELADVDWTPVS